MYLTEKQEKTINDLEMLRKRVELLESHKMVMPTLINEKQYRESLKAISDEVEKIEQEYGVKRDDTNSGLKACLETLNEISIMLGKMQIRHKELPNWDDMVKNALSSAGIDDETYNRLVHKAIDEV